MNAIRAPPQGEPDMNDILALLLLGVLLSIVQCKCDHRTGDLAELARRNTWLAWQAMHPELFTPGSRATAWIVPCRPQHQPAAHAAPENPMAQPCPFPFPLPKSPSPY